LRQPAYNIKILSKHCYGGGRVSRHRDTRWSTCYRRRRRRLRKRTYTGRRGRSPDSRCNIIIIISHCSPTSKNPRAVQATASIVVSVRNSYKYNNNDNIIILYGIGGSARRPYGWSPFDTGRRLSVSVGLTVFGAHRRARHKARRRRPSSAC